MALEEELVREVTENGPAGEKVLLACERLTSTYNSLAMQMVEQEDFEAAYELLKKAEVMTEDGAGLSSVPQTRLRLRAITFNNFGCYFKRKGKLHAALQYLEEAWGIEQVTLRVENPAGTLLNICATLSELGRHHEAVKFAQEALQIQTAELDIPGRDLEKELLEVATVDPGATGKIGMLAVAFHNLATQQEHLNKLEEALKAYEMACWVADLGWGPNSPMAASLRKTHDGFRRKFNAWVRRRSNREAMRGPSGLPRPGDAKVGPTRVGSAPAHRQSSRKAPRPQSARVGGASGRKSGREPRSAGRAHTHSIYSQDFGNKSPRAPRQGALPRPSSARPTWRGGGGTSAYRSPVPGAGGEPGPARARPQRPQSAPVRKKAPPRGAATAARERDPYLGRPDWVWEPYRPGRLDQL